MKTFGAIIAISLTAGSANGADFSFAGGFNNDNEVQEFNFTVAEAVADVTLRTWSYAGGTNAQGTVIERGGFDPVVSLFNGSTGALIGHNDDGHLILDPVNGFGFDSFLMSNLSAGSYTATVTQYSNFSVGALADGFDGSGRTNFGNRDSHWALDVLNVESASLGASYISSPIPEPETYALLLAGLGLIGFMTRFRRE
ncbi:DVUA0089 family protein [Nitrosovibrio sp. Nv4]|uniref:DVUA0089 family protein n=1 Tax=Nitrosovibrio sp. Nv4 TaxID=1945880 RepID=UPI000BD23A04|nr:DVUA0089 family protein [Nitrosovibrio sp. Nv4]SOD41701.1 PEP-CTERM protein-sorting domain-containing protein [Nitrosovibrio sp. Nv4]